MSNKVRDIMLTLGTGSLIVLTTLFGMKQCSGDCCGKKCKEPVNVKVTSVKDDCGCKDTVVVIVNHNQNRNQNRNQSQKKVVVNDTVRNKVVVNDTVRNRVVVNDTVRNVVSQDTVKSVKPSIAWGYACSIGSCNQR